MNGLALTARSLSRSLLGGALLVASLALAAPAAAAPQGDLAPPRGAFGPGPGDASRGGPGDQGGVVVTDNASWARWWAFNRDPYLVRVLSPAAVPIQPAPLGQPAPVPHPSRPANARLYGEVVPALLDLLERSGRDLDVQGAVLLALGKIGEAPAAYVRGLGDGDPIPPRLGEVIKERLDAPNETVQNLAVLALGLLGEAEHEELLTDVALGTKAGRKALGGGRIDRRTRAFATYALANIGARTHRAVQRQVVSQQLLRVLEEAADDTDIATAAVIGAGLCPTPFDDEEPLSEERPGRGRALAALLEALNDRGTDDRARAQIPVALARLVTARASAGADPPERAAARESLRLRVVEACLGLLTAKRDALPGVRQGTVQALGLLVTLPLELAEAEKTPDVRALRLLEQIAVSGQEREGGLALLSLARVAERSLTAGGKPGAAIVQSLRTYATVGDASRRPWGLIALGLIAGELPRAVDGFPAKHIAEEVAGRLRTGPSPEERSAAAIALGLLGATDTAEHLLPGLEEGDFKIRGLYALGLALMGAREASILKLREIALSGVYRPYLLRDVSIALALIGDTRLADILAAKLGVARFMPERTAVLQAYTWTRSERAIDDLSRLLTARRSAGKKVDETTRAFAAAALGALCAAEAAPWNARFALDVTWSAAPPSLTDRRDGGGVLDLL